MISPKDVIDQLSVEELCQTADQYFSSISDPTPLMAKPFGSLAEAPDMLQNMGLLLSGLKLSKTMTVLEFGSGTCWFSRYLNQAQCVTISCDASKTALDIGKRLFNESNYFYQPVSEPKFLHFNGRKIDLPDESVDRIVCFDAFHHVPNQEEVISELARVLKHGGIAGFCEPGLYHSQSPQSQYEMKNYNVLENDVVMPEIYSMARKHGFTDIEFKFLCDMSMSLPQHQRIINSDKLIPERKGKLRPIINIINYMRKALDISRSKDMLSISAHASKTMTDKTIFFLQKGNVVYDSRGHIGLMHRIKSSGVKYDIKSGESIELSLSIKNTGASKWLIENYRDIGVVRIGTHLYNHDGKLYDLDFSRHDLLNPVEPGEEFMQKIKVDFPNKGQFKLAVDLVSEEVCWFENVGSKPFFIDVNVT